jgi:hypothetical protein
LRNSKRRDGPRRNSYAKDEVDVARVSRIIAMKWPLGTLLVALVASTAMASPRPAQWQTYSIAETGTSVDIPTSIFTEKAGRPDGYGERLKTADGKAELTVLAAPNVDKDTPATFLAKKHPPTNIEYRRVTSRFFAVSGHKHDKVYYSRCNFWHGVVQCVIIDYPTSEERDWDDIVTRISLSLSGK